MKQTVLKLLALVAILSSCNRSSDDVWNDTQSAGRHMARGIKTLAGYHGESREVSDRDAFFGSNRQPREKEYIGFDDEDEANDTLDIGEGVSFEESYSPPSETPGEEGSSIPGIDSFQDPQLHPELVEIFKNIQFEYNSSLIRGPQNIATLQKVADWMKTHPHIYIFVEGHCDSRGPSAYNFALGANRSNAVRNMLIKEGIGYDRVYTISFGKERPLIEGEGEEIWRVNRRGQFKIYEKR